MEWLNYHHLLYFWVVAKEGSIASACKTLRLAQPTISGQLHALEESLGEKLFERSGRGLVMTEVGHMVFRYADQIFSLGQELRESLRGQVGRKQILVGVAETLPKLVTYKILEPVRNLEEPMRLVVREAHPEQLVTDLAVHQLDVVLTDAPLNATVKVKAFNHLLGESAVGFFAVQKLATQYKKGFPESLTGAPLLLPSDEAAVRSELDQWMEKHNVHPTIVGEFADSALRKIFAEQGDGLVPLPLAIEEEVKRQHGLYLVGRAEGVFERYYAISIERKLKHPAVKAISEAARKVLRDPHGE